MAVVAESAKDLRTKQAELQLEARAVEADLRLHELLALMGEINRVGSAALGLMVWRDLDLTVVYEKLALRPVTTAGAQLAAHPRVHTVTFRSSSSAPSDDAEQVQTAQPLLDGQRVALVQLESGGDIRAVASAGRQAHWVRRGTVTKHASGLGHSVDRQAQRQPLAYGSGAVLGCSKGWRTNIFSPRLNSCKPERRFYAGRHGIPLS